jgi:hypothetical protein
MSGLTMSAYYIIMIYPAATDDPARCTPGSVARPPAARRKR